MGWMELAMISLLIPLSSPVTLTMPDWDIVFFWWIARISISSYDF